MAIHHRKLLSEQDSNQTATCSDCGPTCPYKCSYPEIYWSPQSAPLPPQTIATIHLAPYVIIIVALLGSAFLFISYYLIMVRCCTRFRRPPTTQVYSEADEFSDEGHDHPIWYIATIGLQPSVINSITVIKFNKCDNLIDGTDCSVCLSEFEDDETLRLLPKCNHAFHIPCIDMWLRSHTNCPLCRAGILSNTLSAVLSPNDRSFSHGAESNRNIHLENSENIGEFDGNRVSESQVCEDSKAEYESVMEARRSTSMESSVAADIVLEGIEGNSGDEARFSRPRSAEEAQEHEENKSGG